MAEIVQFDVSEWQPAALPQDVRQKALRALESGSVLVFPKLPFAIPEIAALFAGGLSLKSKNVSFDPDNGSLRGIEDETGVRQAVSEVMARYARSSARFVKVLFPSYGGAIAQGRTSFRPAEISGRKVSWRKDDTRLHVDSFPSTPVHGKRILRIFTNINPGGEPRSWRTGEKFEAMAARFLPGIHAPIPGTDVLLHCVHATKTRRSLYDHYMLRLHDAMKSDDAYQTHVEQSAHQFASGTTWMTYTDCVSHAAMKGSWALEQTFYLSPENMADPGKSPLRVLESMLGRRLTTSS